jgi:hypothetical protein
MWLAPLPVALVPLWHEPQVPVTWAWSTRNAGRHALVAWQLSQLVSVVMCELPLPVALVPLWQLKQLPVIPE